MPAVYCPGPGRDRIVISAGAMAALTEGQIRAVLAHERAHLRCRHHPMLTLTTGLARAFPRVPLLDRARVQVGVLAEMAADAAVRGHRGDDLAAALVILAGAGRRPAALTTNAPPPWSASSGSPRRGSTGLRRHRAAIDQG